MTNARAYRPRRYGAPQRRYPSGYAALFYCPIPLASQRAKRNPLPHNDTRSSAAWLYFELKYKINHNLIKSVKKIQKSTSLHGEN
ncbi:MAG: hypothetical protein IJ268_01970 [Proteobacteria bacterium]|nr:hypothetical protein [Pseudomonadota bacterium]